MKVQGGVRPKPGRSGFMGKRKTIKVALVDGQPVVRKGIEVSLLRDAGLRLVGSAATVEEAARSSLDSPDVFVIDTNSIESTTRQIHDRFPDAKIVVFASAGSAELVRQAARVGVGGYLLKSSSEEELIRAIKVAHAGGVHFSASLSQSLATDMVNKGESSEGLALTPREREVLRLVAEGHTSRDIADLLRVSVRTVHSHREHIARKLGIRSVAGLTRFAIAHGLIPAN